MRSKNFCFQSLLKEVSPAGVVLPSSLQYVDLRYNRPCAGISAYPKLQLQATKRRNPVISGRCLYIIGFKDY